MHEVFEEKNKELRGNSQKIAKLILSKTFADTTSIFRRNEKLADVSATIIGASLGCKYIALREVKDERFLTRSFI